MPNTEPGTLQTFYLINNVEDIVIFLGFKMMKKIPI